ncbi:hypothetical protein GIB67_015617 [Kingdonia uniflora]|uniref:Uncharacterized protein n=1 Tax=Kingdonia uniflora TaxID=39325 RepID=A0A7J7NTX1_9MAGN|nr:hypothetical protein GIB67_015617 [Kingdonia uniflora]
MNDLKNVIIYWGGRWYESGETGYTHRLYIDGDMHIFKNVDGDQFYYQGLLEYIMPDVVRINETISPSSGIVVKILCASEIVDVCDDASLYKMWHCNDGDNMWDAHFYAETNPDSLDAEEGYYSNHSSVDSDDGPTQVDIDRCDDVFRDLAKEYCDNIFVIEEAEVHHTILPVYNPGLEMVIGMEWPTVDACRAILRWLKEKEWEEVGLVLVPRAQTHIDKMIKCFGQYQDAPTTLRPRVAKAPKRVDTNVSMTIHISSVDLPPAIPNMRGRGSDGIGGDGRSSRGARYSLYYMFVLVCCCFSITSLKIYRYSHSYTGLKCAEECHSGLKCAGVRFEMCSLCHLNFRLGNSLDWIQVVKVLSYNGTPMANTEQPFRLNWASFNPGERLAKGGQDHSIFVGDLGSDVTDAILPMRINIATPRKPSRYQQQSQGMSNAKEALQGLNGTTIGKNTVSLFWGRSSVNKQAYDGSYVYATPVSQDPNMYAVATTVYGTYPTYGNNRHQVQRLSSFLFFLAPFFSYPLEELEERECHIRIHGYVLKQRTPMGVILSVPLAAAIEYSSIKEAKNVSALQMKCVMCIACNVRDAGEQELERVIRGKEILIKKKDELLKKSPAGEDFDRELEKLRALVVELRVMNIS